MWYSIVALDEEGCEVYADRDSTSNKACAKKIACGLLGEKEYLDAGMVKVEVQNDNGECEWDDFVE